MTYQFTGDDALPPGRRRIAELGWNVARFVNRLDRRMGRRRW
jgi:hypothetical protein